MGVKNVIKKAAGKAGDAVAKLSSLSPAQVEQVQLLRETYLLEMPDPTDTYAQSTTERMIAASSIEIFNAYLAQIKDLYLPLEKDAEYGDKFEAKYNIRYFKITRWVTEKNENSLEKLINVYAVLSNEDCNIALIFNRTQAGTDVYLAVVNLKNANNKTDADIYRDRLADAVKGNFPGSDLGDRGIGIPPCLDNQKRYSVAATSNIPTEKSEKFVSQTIEKLLDGIVPDSPKKEYTIILLATPILDAEDRKLKLSEFYSGLAPYASWQTDYHYNESQSLGSAADVGASVGTDVNRQSDQSLTTGNTEQQTDSESGTKTKSENKTSTQGKSDTESSTQTETEGTSNTSSTTEGTNTSLGVNVGVSIGSQSSSSVTNSQSASATIGQSVSGGFNGAGLSATASKSSSVSASVAQAISSVLSSTIGLSAGANAAVGWNSSVTEAIAKSASTALSKGTSNTVSSSVAESTGVSIAKTVGKAVTKGLTTTTGTSKGLSLGVNFGMNFARSSTITATLGKNEGITQTFTNYNIKHALDLLENQMKRMDQSTALGMWDFAAYVLSEDPNVANNVAHTYLALTLGEESYMSKSAINLWRGNVEKDIESKEAAVISSYLRELRHPIFGLNPSFLLLNEVIEKAKDSQPLADFLNAEILGNEDLVKKLTVYLGISASDQLSEPDLRKVLSDFNVYPSIVTATTSLSRKELAYSLNFPQKSIAGLPIQECAEFGRNVAVYDTINNSRKTLKLGNIFHMNTVENIPVELSLNSLASHTFITGSTGSGKSNTIYQLLSKAIENNVKFLVIEPAKGEYKTIFGHRKDVSVYGTNPKLTPLLRMNPFSFPDEVHIFEHLDRLIEIFNVCWPMYAAMPAVLKKAVEQSYVDCGWDLLSSDNKYGCKLYPTFQDVAENIKKIIDSSEYDAENKGAYKGSLLTRLESLTNGINGLIFSTDELSAETLFESNVIVDLSRIGSSETKALLMGMLVLKLQEYRMASSSDINTDLHHVTVLEEAHNILRRTSTEQTTEGANLLGKSVEMLSNAIAEMRTYGEGFIIADQSPGLMDMSVIRNTNTKIIMRLPDQGDRELVGRAANLNDDQIAEISRLPCGVAAVYQNEWIQPVLCQVEKYHTGKIFPYNYHSNKMPPSADVIKKQLLDILMSNGFSAQHTKNKMAALRHDIIESGISTPLKRDFLNYISNSSCIPEEKIRSLSIFLYNLLSAEDVINDARKYDNNIHMWIKFVSEKTGLSGNGYSKEQTDIAIALILYEKAERDAEYNNLLTRFVDIHKEKGGLFYERISFF